MTMDWWGWNFGAVPPEQVKAMELGTVKEAGWTGKARVSTELAAVNRYMQAVIDQLDGIIVGSDGITYQVTKRGDNYYIKPVVGGAEMAAVVWFSQQGLSQQEQEARLGSGINIPPAGGWAATPTGGTATAGGEGEFNFEQWLASQGVTGAYGPEHMAYLYAQLEQERQWYEQQVGRWQAESEQDRWWREQQMGLAYNEWLGEMQRSPLDWTTMWNITRGQQAPSWSTQDWGGWWSPQAGSQWTPQQAAPQVAGAAAPQGGGWAAPTGTPQTYSHGAGVPLTTQPYAGIAAAANQMYGGQIPMVPGWSPENMAIAFPGIEPMLQPGVNIPRQ